MSTFFVFFSHDYLLASGNEFFLNVFAKVVVNVAESKHVLINRVVFEPFHRFVKVVVLSLKILELKFLAQNHFVESTSKVSINQLFFN